MSKVKNVMLLHERENSPLGDFCKEVLRCTPAPFHKSDTEVFDFMETMVLERPEWELGHTLFKKVYVPTLRETFQTTWEAL